jgi:hypothetical protein
MEPKDLLPCSQGPTNMMERKLFFVEFRLAPQKSKLRFPTLMLQISKYWCQREHNTLYKLHKNTVP